MRGLGGAVVAAPFLGSLSGRGLKAQSAAPAKRLIAMFTHYGCVTTRFFPAKSHGSLTAADLTSTTLSPLAPFADKLLIPRGIRAMNEWTSTLARGQGNDPNGQVAASFFTCQPVSPNSNDPFRFSDSALFAPRPVGPSLDHVIAQQLSPMSVPLFMRVGNRNDNAMSAISYSASQTVFPGLGQPRQAFTLLTGLFATGAPVSPDTYAAVRGKSVLDLVRDDLETLKRFDMSGSDRGKLDAWETLLDQTGTVVAAQCSPETGARLGATQANVDAAPTLGASSDILTTALTASLDLADLFSALAVLAAACNANPVIFLKYPAEYLFSGLGLTIDAHSLSHRLNNHSMAGTCVPGVLDMLLTIDRYYAQKFAKLVALLDDLPEGDGTTALDNSAAVWFQEMSDGAAHNLNNLPIVQAGSAGGYFKTGWTVNVDDGSPTLSNGNSESACLDDPPSINGINQTTGTDPTLANAPINKYYCNLMNALGVKAGADGFPLKDGPAEVTRFGMYDKTEDFIGGGSVLPVIHSPGAFDTLKANG